MTRLTTKFLWLFISLLWVFTPGLSARAQTIDDVNVKDGQPLVVELFTSVNCSACMEADRLLYDLSKKKNVIALGCHVEYWDAGTVKDPTGLEACTYRQWTYKSSGTMSSAEVTVPNFIFNGRQSIQKLQIRNIFNYILLELSGGHRHPLAIDMKWKDQKNIYVTLPETGWKLDKRDSFSVWLIRYQDSLVKKVDDGQTAGRVLRFTNVVKNSRHIAKWHGEKRTIEVEVDVPQGGAERGGYVVMIHSINGSEVVGAGKLADFKIKKKPAVTKPEVTTPSK